MKTESVYHLILHMEHVDFDSRSKLKNIAVVFLDCAHCGLCS